MIICSDLLCSTGHGILASNSSLKLNILWCITVCYYSKCWTSLVLPTWDSDVFSVSLSVTWGWCWKWLHNYIIFFFLREGNFAFLYIFLSLYIYAFLCLTFLYLYLFIYLFICLVSCITLYMFWRNDMLHAVADWKACGLEDLARLGYVYPDNSVWIRTALLKWLYGFFSIFAL